MGYRGSIQRYRTLDEYDNYAQGGYFELRHQPSRRYHADGPRQSQRVAHD